MSRTLYDIAERYQNIWNLCTDDADDSDLDKLENALQSIEGELNDKVYNIIGLLQDLKSLSNSIADEYKRLAAKKKSLDSKIERIKGYSLSYLQCMGKSKVVTSRGTMSVVNVGGKLPLVIDDESLIPNDFKFIVSQVDKDALRQAIESGEQVNGAHIATRPKCLRIS